MATCDWCGEHVSLPYQCRRCGQSFCPAHRLPENHDCPGLDEWGDPAGVFGTRSGPDETQQGWRARVTAPGGVLGYLRGNMSFLFLALMWITFALQFALLPLIGFGPRSAVWQGLFVLDPGRLGYIWTWVTSIFAHGGFSHIAVNSIVLYFFGQVVERRLGSQRFAALFLTAGVIAGLAQVGSTLVTIGALGPGVVGASGAIMGIMAVLTMLNPHLRVYLYFIVPVPLWLLTFGFAAFSIVAGFGTAGGGIAHIAHLSGLLIGLAYGVRVRDEVGVPEQLRFGPGGSGRRRF